MRLALSRINRSRVYAEPLSAKVDSYEYVIPQMFEFESRDNHVIVSHSCCCCFINLFTILLLFMYMYLDSFLNVGTKSVTLLSKVHW